MVSCSNLSSQEKEINYKEVSFVVADTYDAQTINRVMHYNDYEKLNAAFTELSIDPTQFNWLDEEYLKSTTVILVAFNAFKTARYDMDKISYNKDTLTVYISETADNPTIAQGATYYVLIEVDTSELSKVRIDDWEIVITKK